MKNKSTLIYINGMLVVASIAVSFNSQAAGFSDLIKKNQGTATATEQPVKKRQKASQGGAGYGCEIRIGQGKRRS
jgi:hypothetical protein